MKGLRGGGAAASGQRARLHREEFTILDRGAAVTPGDAFGL